MTITTQAQSGYTALICAALDGRIDRLRLLLERGAKMDASDEVRRSMRRFNANISKCWYF